LEHPLLDVIVLCSDGLVEEGVFLGAKELAELVSAHTGPGLAVALVEAACALHRPPEEEAEGSGDDVTCVVVRAFDASNVPGPD
jgi:serine/threonine protein phosphatase PrpC